MATSTTNLTKIQTRSNKYGITDKTKSGKPSKGPTAFVLVATAKYPLPGRTIPHPNGSLQDAKNQRVGTAECLMARHL